MTRTLIRVWAICFGIGLCFSGAAHCEDRKRVDWITPTLMYGAGQGADIYTTLHAEARGATEANGFIGPRRSGLYGAKGAAFLILESTDLLLQKSGHPKWAWGERIAATVVAGVVAVHNSKVRR